MTFHPTENPEFWKETAASCFESGRYEKAAEAYLRITEMTPNDFEAWLGRGKSLFFLEKYGDAVSVLERCLVLSPDNKDALKFLADAFGKLESNEKRASCILRMNDL
ncbi:MAG: tetratricopeptide repeat protein [Methanocorpusculum sp.]|nr:tetratricopeptide repeat protein [Methanocorpusculum sp.]